MKPVSALLSCSSIDSDKYFLTPTFCMCKARKCIFRLQPPVKSSGPSQATAREGACHSLGFRHSVLVTCQTRIWKKFHHAKAFPGICCAAAVHRPCLSRCTGLVVSISCKSVCKYLALLKIRHQVPVLQCSCPCSTPSVC